jgi:hypothetical protein
VSHLRICLNPAAVGEVESYPDQSCSESLTFVFACNVLQLVRLSHVQTRTTAVVFSFEFVEAEVRQFDDPTRVHEAVGRLEVPVDSHRGFVQVCHALDRDTVDNQRN